MKKIVIAITGASGSIYSKLLLDKLEKLRGQWDEVSVVITENAKQVWKTELGDSEYQKKSFNRRRFERAVRARRSDPRQGERSEQRRDPDPGHQGAGEGSAEQVDRSRLADAAGKLTAALSSVEEAIYQVRNQSSQDPLNFPIKINNRLASLLRVVNAGDGKPIANAEPIFRDLSAELKVQTDKLQQILGSDLPELNKEVARVGLAAVAPK